MRFVFTAYLVFVAVGLGAGGDHRTPSPLKLRRFLYENGLALFFGAIFLLALAGQAFAGWHSYNVDQAAHSSPELSLVRYLTSSSFAVAVTENWQSEYLQFTLYILVTVWLLQKGSPESKPLGEEGHESEEEERAGRARAPGFSTLGKGRRPADLRVLELAGHRDARRSGSARGRPRRSPGASSTTPTGSSHQVGTVSLLHYLGTASFWERTLQNWQSEFLAVGSAAILSVYLRQRGSPESKPVGAPHDQTGS